MGKVALMAIAAFSIMSGYYGLNTERGMQSTGSSIAQHQHEVLTRNAALAGYDRAMQQLAEDFNNTTAISGSFEDVAYTVDISTYNTEYRRVISKGTMEVPGGADGVVYEYLVEAQFDQIPTAQIHDEPPAFMQYAVLSEGDLTFSGDVNVDVHITGSTQTELNANVHTNGNLKTNGQKAKIKGFGTYKNSADVKFEEKNFKPYYNPAGDDVIRQITEGVHVPAAELDGPTMAATASTLYPSLPIEEHTYLNLDQPEYIYSDDPEKPSIIHVSGDLDITGNTKLSGYVMFIVDGDINISGNVTQGSHDEGSENHAAFYAGDDVTISGTSDLLWGQIAARDQVIVQGTPEIYGNIAAGGQVDIQGTPDIKYYPASPALTTIWQEPATRLKMIAYSER